MSRLGMEESIGCNHIWSKLNLYVKLPTIETRPLGAQNAISIATAPNYQLVPQRGQCRGWWHYS